MNSSHYAEEAETLPVPTCPECGGQAVETETRYGLRADCCGLWSWDRHPLVDAETHEARKEVHKVFDALWQTSNRRLKRNSSYTLLAGRLGLSRRECHFKYMSKDLARRAIAEIGKMRQDLGLDEPESQVESPFAALSALKKPDDPAPGS